MQLKQLEIAEEAISLITMDIEPLPIYVTPEEALKEGAVDIHPGYRQHY
ncbi:hypothetical protein [endosymbiont 'TC1' of Trimyema compressum]|nr:hypothetical protein [endosymbiont 'TC1' of Trimyema compressum]